MVGLDTPLTTVVGASTAKLIAAELDLHTAGELLRHYPRRYAERGEPTDIASLQRGEHATLLATIRSATPTKMRSRRGELLKVVLTDGHSTLDCTFFNPKPFQKRTLVAGRQGLFAGKVELYRNRLQLTHPTYLLMTENTDEADIDDFARPIIPVYPATSRIESWVVSRAVRQALDVTDVPDPLPPGLVQRRNLMGLARALRLIHRPDTPEDLPAARKRLKWDEALAVQLALAARRRAAAARPAPACPPRPGGILDAFDARLPFTLTGGQRQIGSEISADLSGVHPMNRLIQGEVGSGKTVIALRAILQVVDAGRQAALLAPTEVLAAQHVRSLRELLGPLGRAGELDGDPDGTRLTLLTGSLSARERKQALLDAACSSAGLVVGTHALIQDRVGFADLGLVVVDEQHRFGVEQRDALRVRAGDDASPHVLVMTATPIPRTVAMTVYGDLEVSSLRELPAGRARLSSSVVPVAEKPHWIDRVWARIAEEVAAGHQAYVVCPRIGEGAAAGEDVPPLADEPERRPPLAVLDLAPSLIEGPLAGLRVDILHGRLPSDEKDAVMRAFAAGSLDVLVATTVIEVGVDVPNATVMVIMDADRFGVSQLHQLRGRVGRGTAPGLCLLVTEMPDGTPARARLDATASTHDGFELARLDLEMRREGDILGAAQSGRRSTLQLLSLLRDEPLITEARAEATAIIAADPHLTNHPGLAALVADLVTDDRAEYLQKA
ncbi:MAG TPA: ATP-dependent DNA helicase RecG [Pseudonocardiaceae bacterium]|nr:ATP-dependent DNA helicase RecG [Pseudonocardiaceae bacterium]